MKDQRVVWIVEWVNGITGDVSIFRAFSRRDEAREARSNAEFYGNHFPLNTDTDLYGFNNAGDKFRVVKYVPETKEKR